MKDVSLSILLLMSLLINVPAAYCISLEKAKEAPASFSELMWESRVIITSLPENKAQQNHVVDALYQQRSRLDERKLRVFLVQGEQVYEYSLSDTKARQITMLNESFAKQVKQRLASYHTLLIGLDGGSKASYESLAFDELYREIDGMPMRRSELNKE